MSEVPAPPLVTSLDQIDLQMLEAKENLLRQQAEKALREDQNALLIARADDFKLQRKRLRKRIESRPPKLSWLIEEDGNHIQLTRMHNGKPLDAYPPVHRSMAGVYLQAIVQGFHPPRVLTPIEPPAE